MRTGRGRALLQPGKTQMRHGPGNSEAAGDSEACDCHVDSGAESPEDSARRFAALASAVRLVLSVAENGICSVDIKYILWKFILDVTGDLISLLGLTIYLEIIELNFCNLNYDTRKSISKRSISDSLLDLNEKDFIFLENGDVEEISIDPKRKNKKNKNSIELAPN